MTAPIAAALTPVIQDYSVQDLADRWQCSSRHIWRLIDAGKIPGVLRLGRLVRLHRPTIDAWLAAGAPPRVERERMQKCR